TEPYVAKLIADGAALPEFALLDLDRGTVEPLVDGPALGVTAFWAPSGGSLVIANAFLPLDVPDSVERRLRAVRPGIAEAAIRSSSRRTASIRRRSLRTASSRRPMPRNRWSRRGCWCCKWARATTPRRSRTS